MRDVRKSGNSFPRASSIRLRLGRADDIHGVAAFDAEALDITFTVKIDVDLVALDRAADIFGPAEAQPVDVHPPTQGDDLRINGDRATFRHPGPRLRNAEVRVARRFPGRLAPRRHDPQHEDRRLQRRRHAPRPA